MNKVESVISLRPIEYRDIDDLNEWKNNKEVFKYLGGGFSPTSIDCQKKWMDKFIDLSGNNRRFIIEYNKHSVGLIGLYNINWIHRTSELGIYIGNQSFQGKGIGNNACELIEEYAKNYLNLRKIKLFVVDENHRAKKMYKKLGYKEVGKLIDERFIDGKYYSLIIMEKFL